MRPGRVGSAAGGLPGLRRLPRRSAEGGFTLIELLTVLVLIGILATIVIPRYQAVINKARAASVLGDVRVIQFAYSNFMAIENGRARNAGWGRVPPEIEDYLPGGFEFRTDFADYRWTRVRARASPFGAESVMLRVRPVRGLRPELINAIAGMANENTTTVTRNQVRFYLAP